MSADNSPSPGVEDSPAASVSNAKAPPEPPKASPPFAPTAGGLKAPPKAAPKPPPKAAPKPPPQLPPEQPAPTTEKVEETVQQTDLENAEKSEPAKFIRIFFLRSLETESDSHKVSLLVEAFGRDAVCVPSLGTRRILTAFGMGFATTAILMLALVVLTFMKSNFTAGVIALLALIFMCILAFFLAWRSVAQLVVRQAVLHAAAAFRDFRPNVIVASSYGAVVALQMDIPKLPLVLLSPAQDVYYRYMHLRPLISINDYPYCIVVSGSKDSQIPLDDSIRLVESAQFGRCRLEVLDDDHSFRTLRAEDFRTWVEEAYQKGAEIVRSDAAKGNKNYDPSLFDEQPPASAETNP